MYINLIKIFNIYWKDILKSKNINRNSFILFYFLFVIFFKLLNYNRKTNINYNK